jgi:hypothetical protein
VRAGVHRGVSASVIAASLVLFAPPARADPTKAQCLDAHVKAQDLRRDGKLAAAREKLRVCASASCPSIVRDDCTKRQDEIDTAQPTIVFEAKDGAGNDLVAVRVTMDGAPLSDRLGGIPLAIDPGDHTFVFEVPGQPPVTRQFVLREHEQGRHEAIVLGPAPASPRATTPPPAPVAATSSAPPTRAAPSTQKVLGLVAVGLGVVGLGVGGVFGVLAMSKKSDAQSACPNLCSDQGGVDKWNDAVTAGNVSTAAFIAGGVLVAAGAVLWITAPSSSTGDGPSVGLGMAPGGMQVTGRW